MMIVLGLLLLLVLGGFVYLFLYGVWSFFIQPLFKTIKKERINYHVHSAHNPEVAQQLSWNFKYYQNLHPDLKPFFVWRVIEFMNSKQFIGREDLAVTKEMKILISAAAIQVTFGLKKFRFNSFGKILIYPKKYYSRISKQYHKGEVNLAGAIVFSWEDFKTGFSYDNDNYNVGLHEMAHALRFDKFRNDEFDEFFVEYFDKFLAVGRDEFLRARNKQAPFIREYAGANKEEFFSVCVEYFFESPYEMKQKLPELFLHLCILLNQDPSADYKNIQPVRETLLNKEPAKLGDLFYSSPATSIWILVPFSGFLCYIFFQYWASFEGSFTSDSAIKLACFIVLYIAAGGLFISTKCHKFHVYQNSFAVTYPLNPFVKAFVLNFDKIISATFTHHGENEHGHSSDVLKISYARGINIRSKEFSLSGLSDPDIERLAACLKRKKVMIKVTGGKWLHEDIIDVEKQLPLSF